MVDVDPLPDDVVLSCGCVVRAAIINGDKTLTISPCRQACPNFARALDIAASKGITPEYLIGE